MGDDFDFEDLDRAVSDLLDDKNDDKQASKDRNEVVAAEKSEVREKWNLPRKSDGLSDSPENKVPDHMVRSHGRFMDMVHPSSDATLTKKQNYAKLRQASEVERAAKIARELAATTNEEKIDDAVNPSEDFIEKIREPEDLKSRSKSVFSRKFRGDKSETLVRVPAADKISGDIKTSAAQSDDISRNDDKSKSESPFLTGVKVDKQPLGSARPTSQTLENVQPEEKLLQPSESDLGTELELTEDNFITGFLGEIKKEAESDNQKTSLDHLSRNNAEGAPKDDLRAALDNSMIMPQYHTSDNAQITESPAPFSNSRSDLISIEKPKHHIFLWIFVFVVVLALGFCAGGAIYLMS